MTLWCLLQTAHLQIPSGIVVAEVLVCNLTWGHKMCLVWLLPQRSCHTRCSSLWVYFSTSLINISILNKYSYKIRVKIVVWFCFFLILSLTYYMCFCVYFITLVTADGLYVSLSRFQIWYKESMWLTQSLEDRSSIKLVQFIN